MEISRSSAVASSAASYANSLRSQRLRDSYQFNVSQLDALSRLNAVSAISSSLLASPSESISTAYFSARYPASTDVRLSTAGKVQSVLSDLKTSLAALAKPESRAPIKSISSDEKIVTGVANDALQLPAFQQVVVSQLAQVQTLESAGFSGAGTEVGSGSLTIRFGSIDGGTGEFSASGRIATVFISSGSTSVSGVASAINKASIGIRAEVVTEANSTRLRFSSVQTGAGEAFTISARDNDASNTDNAGLSRLAYDPAAGFGGGQNMSPVQSAQDALLTINGRSVRSAGNIVRDDTTRTTLTLQATGRAEVSYARDKATLGANVKLLTEAVNTARGQLLALNDGMAQREVQRIQDSINAAESGSGLSRLTLDDLGVGLNNGKLTFNEAKFAVVVGNNPEGVASLLADASQRLTQSVQASLDTNGGLNARLGSLRSLFSTGSVYAQQNSGFSLLQGSTGYAIPVSVQEGLRRYLSIAQL